MIDRSYLPFQVAREYQDRKMAKWMGFFLSEHTAGLDSELNKVDYSSELTLTDKLLLLNQLYSNQLSGIIAKSIQTCGIINVSILSTLCD